mgnify:CR=1 FL=1
MEEKIKINKLFKQIEKDILSVRNTPLDFPYVFGTSNGIPITIEMQERWYNPNNI